MIPRILKNSLKKGKVSRTENKGSYLVDYDKKGGLLGFEVLNYSKAVPDRDERKLVAEVVVDH